MNNKLTIKDVIDRILAYHPQLPDYHGCDCFKCGDPSAVCTGVVTTLSPTVHVVEKAIRLGANLIIVHEPTNYTSMDLPGWHEDYENWVLARKMELLDRHGISVWRDHDHMHIHKPDCIFTGVLKYMGWEEHATVDTSMGMFSHFVVDLPEPLSLRQLMEDLKSTIGLNGVRYIGNPEMTISRLAIVGHLYPMPGPTAQHRDIVPREYSVQIMRYFEAVCELESTFSDVFPSIIRQGKGTVWTNNNIIRIIDYKKTIGINEQA